MEEDLKSCVFVLADPFVLKSDSRTQKIGVCGGYFD